ncbi:MAG: helix-turn-helix domain-containing protein [Lachnospiraceae bacterium]|nr:helix-turn-helix domain-containing protein [Lachnospiraceae bacterium]
MKLNLDTIFYHLKEKYTLEYIRQSGDSQELGRPRYYKSMKQTGDYLWLALNNTGVLPEGCYICTSMPAMSHPKKTSIILIKDSINESDLYNNLQEIYDFYDEWANTCMQNVENFQDFRSLINTTYQMLHIPLCLMDNQFSIVAQACNPRASYILFGENGTVSIDTVNDLISNPHLRHLETAHGELDFDYDQNYKLYNFHYHNRYAGRLVMAITDTDQAGRESLILNQLAEYIEYLLRRFGSFHSTSNAQHLLRTFLSESLSGIVCTPQNLLRLQQNTGWTDEHKYMMVSFLPEHRLKKELYPPYLISQVEELWADACAVEADGDVVMIINMSINGEKNLADFYQSLAYMVRDGLMIAGCSRIFHDLKDIEIFYRQSRFAIEFGQKKDSTRWYFRFNDYALDYLFSYGTGIFKPEQVCHPVLLQLQEHDQNRQTSYYITLYTYFESQFNMSHAAQKLFIHRSTFISRMERIMEMTRLNLDDYDTRLYLEVSFRILNKPDPATISQFYV